METKIYAAYVTTYDDYGHAIDFSADYFLTREEAETYAKARVKEWTHLQIGYDVKEVVIGGEGYGIEFYSSSSIFSPRG